MKLRFLLHYLLTFEFGKWNWDLGPVKGSSDFPNPQTCTSHNGNSYVKTKIVVLQCSHSESMTNKYQPLPDSDEIDLNYPYFVIMERSAQRGCLGSVIRSLSFVL